LLQPDKTHTSGNTLRKARGRPSGASLRLLLLLLTSAFLYARRTLHICTQLSHSMVNASTALLQAALLSASLQNRQAPRQHSSTLYVTPFADA
jgi:hypothetical protein